MLSQVQFERTYRSLEMFRVSPADTSALRQIWYYRTIPLALMLAVSILIQVGLCMDTGCCMHGCPCMDVYQS